MNKQRSVAFRLQDELKTIIGEAGPDKRLPSEPKLAKQLGVSRATLREAMRLFESQGLIHRRQGSGTYVMQPAPVIEGGLEILESIETVAKRIGLDVSMGEISIQTRPSSEEESQALGIENEANVVSITRIIKTKERPAAYLVDVLPADIVDPSELTNGFSGSVLDFLNIRGKTPLVSSRCEINAVDAVPEIARALQIQRGVALLRFIAWLYSASGRVIDYSYSYFLPGYFRFHVVRRVGS